MRNPWFLGRPVYSSVFHYFPIYSQCFCSNFPQRYTVRTRYSSVSILTFSPYTVYHDIYFSIYFGIFQYIPEFFYRDFIRWFPMFSLRFPNGNGFFFPPPSLFSNIDSSIACISNFPQIFPVGFFFLVHWEKKKGSKFQVGCYSISHLIVISS